jgi:hypothetical protein
MKPHLVSPYPKIMKRWPSEQQLGLTGRGWLTEPKTIIKAKGNIHVLHRSTRRALTKIIQPCG